jgi:hypothetical protein
LNLVLDSGGLQERKLGSPIEAFRKLWIAVRVVFELDVVAVYRLCVEPSTLGVTL